MFINKPLNKTVPGLSQMAKEKKTQGFQSAAGLIRYFDVEDSKAFTISKWGVFMAGLVAILAVESANAWGRETSGYVLLIGLLTLIVIEYQI